MLKLNIVAYWYIVLNEVTSETESRIFIPRIQNISVLQVLSKTLNTIKSWGHQENIRNQLDKNEWWWGGIRKTTFIDGKV